MKKLTLLTFGCFSAITLAQSTGIIYKHSNYSGNSHEMISDTFIHDELTDKTTYFSNTLQETQVMTGLIPLRKHEATSAKVYNNNCVVLTSQQKMSGSWKTIEQPTS